MVRRYLGSATTNSSGVGTFTYTGTGKGKMKIVAVSDGVESNEYDLYDCKFKYEGTIASESTDSTWGTSTTIQAVRGDEYTTLSNIDDTTFSQWYKVGMGSYTHFEFDLNPNSTSNELPSIISLRKTNTQIGGNFTQQKLGLVKNEWHHIEIDVDYPTAIAKVNGVAKSPNTLTDYYDSIRFSFTENTGLVLKIKNLLMW